MKKLNIYRTLLLLVGVLFFYSCSETTEYPETRLFMPVLNNSLSAQNNTITVDMAKMTKAVSYKVEISRVEDFSTILGTLNTPNNKIVITNLLWKTKYYIRATAIAATEEFNSKVSDLGDVTTDPFPSIMQVPTADDVTDISAKAKWLTGATSGAAITQVKVFTVADEALQNPLATFPVSSAEQLIGEKVVTGLSPSTAYQIAIYSEDVVRGWNTFTTKDALPAGSSVVDLRGVPVTSSILFDTLTAAPAGSTIILDGDSSYDLNTQYYFDKSITIKSGYSLTLGGAVINLNTNFNLLAGSNVGALIFDGVKLTSTDTAAAAKYVFNINQNATIGEITFNNCKMNNFRGICRFQASTGTVGKYTINNCIVNNIGGYGVFNIDVATWTAGDVLFKSSTIYRSTVFMASKSTSPTKSVTVEDCTLNEFVAKAGTMFKWVSDVTNGIAINNTIVGHGYDSSGGTDYAIIGYSGLAATNWTISNSYATIDFTYVTGNLKTIPNFPTYTYAKAANSLWVDPTNGNFNILDSAFSGAKTCGDPRWRK